MHVRAYANPYSSLSLASAVTPAIRFQIWIGHLEKYRNSLGSRARMHLRSFWHLEPSTNLLEKQQKKGCAGGAASVVRRPTVKVVELHSSFWQLSGVVNIFDKNDDGGEPPLASFFVQKKRPRPTDTVIELHSCTLARLVAEA